MENSLRRENKTTEQIETKTTQKWTLFVFQSIGRCTMCCCLISSLNRIKIDEPCKQYYIASKRTGEETNAIVAIFNAIDLYAKHFYNAFFYYFVRPQLVQCTHTPRKSKWKTLILSSCLIAITMSHCIAKQWNIQLNISTLFGQRHDWEPRRNWANETYSRTTLNNLTMRNKKFKTHFHKIPLTKCKNNAQSK